MQKDSVASKLRTFELAGQQFKKLAEKYPDIGEHSKKTLGLIERRYKDSQLELDRLQSR